MEIKEDHNNEEQDILEEIIKCKIAEWEYDRNKQKANHKLKISELIMRINKIKTNGYKHKKKEVSL